MQGSCRPNSLRVRGRSWAGSARGQPREQELLTVTRARCVSRPDLGGVSDVRGLASDLSTEAARASFVNGTTKTKTVIQKFRRRKNYRRLKGHTQPFVRLKIKHILKAGEQAPAA